MKLFIDALGEIMTRESRGIYEKYIKRIFDFTLSFCAIVILSPLLIFLIIVGCIKMKGNPFFTQERPGRYENVFKLIKFRTMSNEKDKNGRLLPDEERLNSYGKFLRLTSLDELPELFNICKGDMSIVGPRPLLVEYLPWYTNTERKRHDIRPGLTGWAQVNGRNSLDWDNRLKADVYYVENLSFGLDVKIFFLTIKKVLMHENVAVNTRDIEPNFAEQRRSKSNIGESEKI